MRTPYTFTVEGMGSFPFELLAKDKCWPTDEIDAQKMYSSTNVLKRASIHTIQLQSYEPPSSELWKRRGWPILRLRRE